MTKVVVYESTANQETEIAIDQRWRVLQRMQSAHVARIDVDYGEIKLARRKEHSKPLVFIMQFGSDETTRFKCEYYVQGDGGYHSTSGGVRLFYPIDARKSILSVSVGETNDTQIDANYNDHTISLATGLGSDAKMLRQLWERVILEDWLLRVIRIVRNQQRAAMNACNNAKSESEKSCCKSLAENITEVLLAFEVGIYSILHAEIHRLDEQEEDRVK